MGRSAASSPDSCGPSLLQVGGDGLFQEALNGLLLLRARSPELGDLAARMRLGHIPAGSTDAVAYSLNGTRSELTAALHVALGDRWGTTAGHALLVLLLAPCFAHHKAFQAQSYGGLEACTGASRLS